MDQPSATSLGSLALTGVDSSTIDKKGRLLLTKKFRERLGPEFTAALGDLECLVLYPRVHWNNIVQSVMKYDSTNPGRAQYARLVISPSEDSMNLDSDGRFIVPSTLKELAKLDTNVLLLGLGDRLEIWDPQEYAKYQEDEVGYKAERRAKIATARKEMMAG